MPKWRPRSRRDDESYDALHEGVPDWLGASLRDFVLNQVTYTSSGRTEPNRGMLQKIERELRSPLDWHFGEESALNKLWLLAGDPDFMLDLVDLCLRTLPFGQEHQAAKLMTELEEAGSAWTVGTAGESFSLVRRVDITVTGAAKSVMSASGRAGQHLAIAWNYVYGRHPEPSSGYREAVRAVEAIGSPVISPLNPTATLGTMIAAVRDTPNKWEVVLEPVSGDAMLMVLEMMRLLWTSELDRHGTADESKPLHVSLEQAQAALHIAVTLVHLFQSGAIHDAKPRTKLGGDG